MRVHVDDGAHGVCRLREHRFERYRLDSVQVASSSEFDSHVHHHCRVLHALSHGSRVRFVAAKRRRHVLLSFAIPRVDVYDARAFNLGVSVARAVTRGDA